MGYLSESGGLGSSLTPVRVPSAILALVWAIAAGCREMGRGWTGGGLRIMSAAGCRQEHSYNIEHYSYYTKRVASYNKL